MPFYEIAIYIVISLIIFGIILFFYFRYWVKKQVYNIGRTIDEEKNKKLIMKLIRVGKFCLPYLYKHVDIITSKETYIDHYFKTTEKRDRFNDDYKIYYIGIFLSIILNIDDNSDLKIKLINKLFKIICIIHGGYNQKSIYISFVISEKPPLAKFSYNDMSGYWKERQKFEKQIMTLLLYEINKSGNDESVKLLKYYLGLYFRDGYMTAHLTAIYKIYRKLICLSDYDHILTLSREMLANSSFHGKDADWKINMLIILFLNSDRKSQDIIIYSIFIWLIYARTWSYEVRGREFEIFVPYNYLEDRSEHYLIENVMNFILNYKINSIYNITALAINKICELTPNKSASLKENYLLFLLPEALRHLLHKYFFIIDHLPSYFSCCEGGTSDDNHYDRIPDRATFKIDKMIMDNDLNNLIDVIKQNCILILKTLNLPDMLKNFSDNFYNNRSIDKNNHLIFNPRANGSI